MNSGQGEECDDGNTLNGDGCSASCLIEYCGDGAVNNGEECDDQNTADGDGCSAACVIEFCGDGVVNGGGGVGGTGGAGGSATGGACTGGSSGFGGCGGTTEVGGGGFGGTGTGGSSGLGGTGAGGTGGGGSPGEQCDDGNTADGDGCSSICTIESSSFIHQFGSSNYEIALSVCADPGGNVIVVGGTWGDIDAVNLGGYDGFVRKLDPNGNVLWSQQFGTPGSDVAQGVDTDESGNIVVTGHTDGAIGGANAGGADAFVLKLDPDGNVLWTQQVGGSDAEVAMGVSVDAAGNSLVGGFTSGPGSSDAFIAKLDPSGALLWFRELGTSENERGFAVAADGSGNAIVVGDATVIDGSGYPNDDVFVGKLSGAGDLLWTATYGSSNGYEHGWGATVDGSNNVLLAGETAGTFGSPAIGADAFVAKLDPNGGLIWVHQFDSNSHEYANGVVTDGAGNVFAAGTTLGSLGAPSAGFEDVFVRKLDPNGNEILTVQIGTDQPDIAYAIALDAAGNVILAGDTKGDLGGPNLGINDAFILKMSNP